MANVEIRLAHKADAESVAQLVFELFEELASPGDSGYEPQAVTRTARSLLNGGEPVWAFLAEDDAHPVGILMLNECASIYAGGLFGEITELYVTPAFRALGVGKRLVQAAAEFARQRGWSRLEVGAPELPKWAETVTLGANKRESMSLSSSNSSGKGRLLAGRPVGGCRPQPVQGSCRVDDRLLRE